MADAVAEATRAASGIRAGDRSAIASALNLCEDRRLVSRDRIGALLDALRLGVQRLGHRIGLTGPPGVGKSTLAGAVARELRRRGRTVGVVAVDPSSIRSGGALLGDRARMAFDPEDGGLFVRSLATEGRAGGLSWAAPAAAAVLGAAFEVVLVETTGVGQTETDVRHLADTVALVIQPGSGDALQFLKAGIMEIPDVLVVNKSDQPQAQRAVSDLRSALATSASVGIQDADTTLVATGAESGDGVAGFVDALDAHRASIAPTLESRRHEGEVEWTVQLFERLHGSHGVAALGGRPALRASASTALAHAAPPRVCTDLSDHFLGTLSRP